MKLLAGSEILLGALVRDFIPEEPISPSMYGSPENVFFNIIFMKLELRLIEDRMCLYNSDEFLLTQRYCYRTSISCTEIIRWDGCCVM